MSATPAFAPAPDLTPADLAEVAYILDRIARFEPIAESGNYFAARDIEELRRELATYAA